MAKKDPDEGRYSKVSRRVWNSRDFRELSAAKPNAQTLWLRLLTGPELTAIPGLFAVREGGLAEELGWPVRSLRRCMQEITDRGMAKFDRKAGLIWVPRGIWHNPPDNPNVIVGWRIAWKELPDCSLKDEAQAAIEAWCAERGNSWENAFFKVTGKVAERVSGDPSEKGSGAGCGKQEKEKEKEIPPTPLSEPETPPAETLADRASWWLQLAGPGSKYRFEADLHLGGDPSNWPEVVEVCDASQRAFGRRDAPRHSGDPRCRVILERFAEGYSPSDLEEAMRGAMRAENIAEKREYQVISTVLKDASRVDKYRSLLDAPAPDRPATPSDAAVSAAEFE